MIGMVYNVIFFQCPLCHQLESNACLRKKHTPRLNMGNVCAGASVHGWWACLSMENQGRSSKGLSAKGRKSLDGTQMKRAKGWGGFMSTCLDLHSTQQFSGTHGGGDAQHSSPSGNWTLSRRAFRSVFCLPNWIISEGNTFFGGCFNWTRGFLLFRPSPGRAQLLKRIHSNHKQQKRPPLKRSVSQDFSIYQD